MSLTKQIRLSTKCIKDVPLDSNGDFYFIVNNEEFKTSKITSDLLFPKICKMHLSDPTFNTFIINTVNKGNFSNILKLSNFKENSIPINEIAFVSEILDILGNEYIKIEDSETITIDNVIKLFEKHNKHNIFKSKVSKEIDFISSHLFELIEREEDCLIQFNINSLERIINNSNIQIEDENQLLSFLNKLYLKDPKYAPLFEYVRFENCNEIEVSDFLNIFYIDDLTAGIWKAISKRLKQKVNIIIKKRKYQKYNRYRNQSIFPHIYDIKYDFK